MWSSQPTLDCTTLARALTQVRSTLQTLVIRHDIHADEALDVESTSVVLGGSLGSLKNYFYLHTLNISLGVLLGEAHSDTEWSRLGDVLPPNLMHLTINDDLWGFSPFPTTGYETMSPLRAFLTGERKVLGEWNDALDEEESTWEKVAEPDWVFATPHLTGFTLDMRLKAYMLEFYLISGEQMESLKKETRRHGLECTVLFDGF